MKVLIIEDELPAARQLTKLLTKAEADIKIIDVIDSVESSVKWLNAFPLPDAIFMDIQIADGLSFDIFNHVTITCPVVFTTAFDHYAVKAFKVNAIDYLLKPIDEDELAMAIHKIRTSRQDVLNSSTSQSGLTAGRFQDAIWQDLLAQMKPQDYKERFLIKQGQSFISVSTAEIAYFFSEDGLTQFYHFQAKKHIIEHTLDELERLLHPKTYFRINRKMILNIKAIQKISPHFNGRLKLEIHPPYAEDILVARERVNDFKTWLGG